MSRYIDGDALVAWIKESQHQTSKMRNVISRVESMPSVDKPTEKWIVVHDSVERRNVRCPNCHMMFGIGKRMEKQERTRWKWCPICGTPMKGYKDGRSD